MGKPIIWSGTNAKLINSGDLVDVNSFSLSDGPKISYPWPSHGLTSADIGRPVRIVSANQLAFAQADTAANAEVAGFIYGIIDSSNVRLSLWGNCPAIGANVIEGGGTTGASIVYFLSDTTAGKITAAEPSNVGSISKPLAIGTSIGAMVFLNYRGATVGSTNARTQISLPNNATTDVQSVTSYDAGSLSGYVTITNSTAANTLRFYVSAPFAKYGGTSNYYISPSYVGDTPPSGFSMTVTAAGSIQITMPNISGYVSATIVYSLNAPAVGTNFPLNLDSANLTNNGITGVTGTAATNAIAASSLKVGEKQTTTITATTAGTSDTDITGASVTLTSGIWDLRYSISIDVTTGATSGNATYGEVVLTDSVNVTIGSSRRSLYVKTTAAVANEIIMPLCASEVVAPTSSTTYKLRCKRTDASGTGSVAVANSGSNLSTFFAIRIA